MAKIVPKIATVHPNTPMEEISDVGVIFQPQKVRTDYPGSIRPKTMLSHTNTRREA